MSRIGPARYVALALEIARKDFRLEARSKRALPMAGALALLVVVVFGFSLKGRHSGSVLWVAFVFAGTLSVMQSVGVEGEHDALDAILLAPIPYSAIYVGKVLSATVFVSGVGLFTVGASWFFLDTTPAGPPFAVIAAILGFAFGFSAVSVIVSSIAVYTRITELLLPVLLVPLVVPGLIAAVQLAAGSGMNWITVLAGYDGIVFVTGVLVFEELFA